MTAVLDVLRTADGEVLAAGLVAAGLAPHASVLSYDAAHLPALLKRA